MNLHSAEQIILISQQASVVNEIFRDISYDDDIKQLNKNNANVVTSNDVSYLNFTLFKSIVYNDIRCWDMLNGIFTNNFAKILSTLSSISDSVASYTPFLNKICSTN